ncbi:MAG: hypothetical protein CBC13_03495 [Planctomycetia bacterium TMED53]|nr:MAG: hypothetical protein CBC13_03495 [Planctomycetia bacterium TMED53]
MENYSPRDWKIRVVIPALDEESSIGQVIESLPNSVLGSLKIDSIHVADNGSKDRTAQIAKEAGARVVTEPRKGYGSACMAAISDLREIAGPPAKEVVVFLDADLSDDPRCLPQLVEPLIQQEADLVLGNRAHRGIDRGSLTLQQRFGNALATTLIRWLHGVHYQDLGPFRACRLETLLELEMQDPDFGWTVEMQLKAAKIGLRHLEIDLPYRRRIGHSKISGTLVGSVKAGIKILSLILFDLKAGSRNRIDSSAH